MHVMTTRNNWINFQLSILYKDFVNIFCIRMENICYIVETYDDDDDEYTKYTESEMRDSIDDICVACNVKSIVKKYRLSCKKGVVFRMTLFTDKYPNISANEYIAHYCNMPADIYGDDIFSDLDKEIVELFD